MGSLIRGMVIEKVSEDQLEEVALRGEDVSFETLDEYVDATRVGQKLYIQKVQPKHDLEAMD